MGGQYPSYSEEGEEIVPSALDQAPYSPADSDLGVQEILMERPERFPVIFDLRSSVFFTDNAPSGNVLTDDQSWVFSTVARAAYRPHLWHGWFGDFGVNYDFVRFDDSSALDYENHNMRLGVFKILPDLDDTIFFMRYEYQRLMTGSLSEGDYNAQRIRAGLQKVLWATPRHQVSSTLSAAYEWTARPEALQRDEISLDVAYRYSITDAIYTVASARAYYFDFDQAGREDWTYSMGLELIWQVSRNFRTSASVYYDKNDSNTPFGFNDFEAWTAGVGIGMEWTF